jgi:hypothetical protein
MLGDLITRLEQPDVAAEVLASLGPVARVRTSVTGPSQSSDFRQA